MDPLAENELIEIDELTCRICLAEHLEAPISLFNQFEGETISQMLNYCTTLEIDDSDRLPKTICESCFVKLTAARDLKQTSLISDEYLKRITRKTAFDSIELIKNEPEEQKKLNYVQYDEKEVHPEILKDYKVSKRKVRKPAKQKFTTCKIRKVPSNKTIEATMNVNEGDPACECPDCGKKFWTNDYFDKHRCQAEKTCSICECKLDSLGELLKHFKDVHRTERKCNLCQRDLNSARDLHFHIRLVISLTRLVSVFLSNISFISRTHSQKNLSYMCDICGKSFYKNLFLKLHRETHSRHYECDICGVILTCRSGKEI